MYESQLEIVKKIRAFKEETISLIKSLQLNLDDQYVKRQKIQDDVIVITSTQASSIITNRSDLLSLKCSMDEFLQGQACDRAKVETLAVTLKNLLSKPKSSTLKK